MLGVTVVLIDLVSRVNKECLVKNGNLTCI